MRSKLSFLFLTILPLCCFSQVVINPGEQVIVKAGACPVVNCPPTPAPVYIHDTVWKCPPVIPPVDPPPPPGDFGTVTYQNGYDKLSDINANQIGCTTNAECANLSQYLSATVFKSGTGSFRSFVPSGGNNVSSGQRSEQQYNGEAYNPTEGVVEYDVLYETGKLAGAGSSIQWHPNNNNSALLFLHTATGEFQVGRSMNGANFYQTGTLKRIELNKWYHLRWEFKWSTGSDGYARFYIDGLLYYSFNGVTQDNNGKPYLKVGQNRWGNLTGGSVVYFDNLKVYKR